MGLQMVLTRVYEPMILGLWLETGVEREWNCKHEVSQAQNDKDIQLLTPVMQEAFPSAV